MTPATKQALLKFTDAVASAIARQANGKDVDWRLVVETQEAFQTALNSETEHP